MLYWTKQAYVGSFADVGALRDLVVAEGGSFRVRCLPILGWVILIDGISQKQASDLGFLFRFE